MTDPTGEIGIPGAVIGAVVGGGAYLVGQALSGQPVQMSGLVLNTLGGAAAGATGAYIYAGVARLGLSTVGNLALNAAGNAVVNVAINAPIQIAQNVQAGQCPVDQLDQTIYKSAFFGAMGGYVGARIAGVTPAAAAAMQQYANRVGNTLLPKGPQFTGSSGPVANATAGAINAFATTGGNVIQSYPTLFP